MPIFELLFGVRRDDPEETVKKLQELIMQETKKGQHNSSKRSGEKYLARIRRGLSDSGNDANSWTEPLCNQMGIGILLSSIMKLEVEGKRSAASILIYLLQCKFKESQIIHIFRSCPEFIRNLMEGYSKAPQVAVCCGLVLRECINLKELRDIILTKDNVATLLKCMSSDAFDAASDAYETLQVQFLL
jgi:hypothetical protein